MVRIAHLFEPERLKRPALVLIAGVVVALGAVGVVASVSTDAVRSEVEASVSALLGRPLRLTGTASTHVLPWPSVRFDAVAFTAADGTAPLARMDRLDVALDIAGLLLGSAHPIEMTLKRPDIRLETSISTTSATDVVARMARWTPATVVIENGRLVAAYPGGDEVFDAIDGRWSWPRPSANTTLRLAFQWRGEPVTIDAAAAAPPLLAGGAAGKLALRLVSEPLRLTFDGSGGPTAVPRFTGTTEIEVSDAARFARWVRRPADPDLFAGRLRLDGRLSADANGVTVADARVDLAGNRGEGALYWRWDLPRPRIGGTVAFAAMDLTDERTRPLGPGLRTLGLDPAGLPIDLDLRLSSPRVVPPNGPTMEKVAAALLIGEGRLHAEIGSAEIFGKPISVVARGTLDGDGLRAQIRGTADDLPLTDFAGFFGMAGVEAGRTSVGFEGESRCRDLGACIPSMEGRVRIAARGATVTGTSPFGDVSRFHPIVPKIAATTATTNWDRVDIDLRLAGPRADVERVEIIGQGARFRFSGNGDLATGALDLIGNAYFPAFRPDPARNGSSEIAVPMRVTGTLRRLEATARDATTTGTTNGGEIRPDGAPAKPVAP